jgi:integrase
MKRYLRLRIRKGRRERVVVSGCTAIQDLDARCKLIRRVADDLVEGGRSDRVKDLCAQLGAAKTVKRADLIVRSVKELLATEGAPPEDILFRDHARAWVTGELHERFPDYVKKKDHRDDKAKLRLYINPLVGDLPVTLFRLEHGELVMRKLPPEFSSASRRHVAQVMHRLLKLAVYPCKLIGHNPLPQGFLPKIATVKAKQYLYPDEESQLLRCAKVPLEYRIAYGVLAREGCRCGELLGDPKRGTTAIEWDAFDLARGMIRLDQNKTNDPRAWVLDPSVLRALRAWRKLSPSQPFRGVDPNHFAPRFRAHLELAGISRQELTAKPTPNRSPIRAHDLRATFVTLSLANGKSEGWITDRTGHKSSAMVNRYRRLARQFHELKLGRLGPMDTVIPELSTMAWAKAGTKGGTEQQGAA